MSSISVSASTCLLLVALVSAFVFVSAAPQKVFLCNTFPGANSQLVFALGPTTTQMTNSPQIAYKTCAWWNIDDTWIIFNISVYLNNNFTAPYANNAGSATYSYCADSNANLWFVTEQLAGNVPTVNLNNPVRSCTIASGNYRVSFYNTYVAVQQPFVDLWAAVGNGAALAYNANLARIGQDQFASEDLTMSTPVTSLVAYTYNTTVPFLTSGVVNVNTAMIASDSNVVVVLSGDSTNSATLWVQYTTAGNAKNAAMHVSAQAWLVVMCVAAATGFLATIMRM